MEYEHSVEMDMLTKMHATITIINRNQSYSCAEPLNYYDNSNIICNTTAHLLWLCSLALDEKDVQLIIFNSFPLTFLSFFFLFIKMIILLLFIHLDFHWIDDIHILKTWSVAPVFALDRFWYKYLVLYYNIWFLFNCFMALMWLNSSNI